MATCSTTEATGSNSKSVRSAPTDTAASSELTAPNIYAESVSDSGSSQAFLSAGKKQTTPTSRLATMLISGSLRMIHKQTPRSEKTIAKISSLALPPTPKRNELRNINPVTITAAPKSHSELRAPLAY
jgi:hypothetical protein